MGMSKEYRKYFSDGKLMQVARMTLMKIGKFGFETSLFGIEPYVLNMNMPIFDTEQEAEEWILSTGKWKSNSHFKPILWRRYIMDINKFCVNDKTCGSCWGTLVAFDKLEELISYENCKMEFQQRLYEWNGKLYLWFKDMSKDPDGLTGDNYFIEI